MRLSELVPSVFLIRIFPYNDDVVFSLYYCNIIRGVILHLAIDSWLVTRLRDVRYNSSQKIDAPIQPWYDFHFNIHTVDGQMLQSYDRSTTTYLPVDPRSTKS